MKPAKLKPSFNARVWQYASPTMGPFADTLELDIYEDIGRGYWGEEGLTAKTIKAAIDGAAQFSRIAVRINSPGGDAFEGVAILNLLKAQKKPIDVFVDGIAASAASIIAMAGDTITMGQGAMMMVHGAWTVCVGNAEAMRAQATVLDQVNESMAGIYVKRTGQTKAAIIAIMDAETWMGAQECLDGGFATAIAEDAADAEQMALAKSFKSLIHLKNVPAALRSKADDTEVGCPCVCPECTNGDCDDCTMGGENCIADEDDGMQDSNLSQYEARLKLLRA